MSCTVKELLDCAEYNLKENTDLGPFVSQLARAQIQQYRELKEAGASDEDDVYEALLKYPQCELKI
jgi:hypothetical protein